MDGAEGPAKGGQCRVGEGGAEGGRESLHRLIDGAEGPHRRRLPAFVVEFNKAIVLLGLKGVQGRAALTRSATDPTAAAGGDSDGGPPCISSRGPPQSSQARTHSLDLLSSHRARPVLHIRRGPDAFLRPSQPGTRRIRRGMRAGRSEPRPIRYAAERAPAPGALVRAPERCRGGPRLGHAVASVRLSIRFDRGQGLAITPVRRRVPAAEAACSIWPGA
jgi:hypothetical protein